MSHSHEGMEVGDRCWDCLDEAFTIKVNALEAEKAELVQTIEAMLRAAMPNGQALSIDEMEAESNAHSTKPSEYITYVLHNKDVLINCLRAHLTREAARVSEEEKKSEAFKAGFLKVKKEKDEGIELMQEAKRLITALTRAVAILSPYGPAEARASCEFIVNKAMKTRDLL